MKLKTKFILLGSFVIFAATPVAFAGGKGHHHKSPKGIAKKSCLIEPLADDVVVSDGTDPSGTDDGTGTDPGNVEDHQTDGGTATGGEENAGGGDANGGEVTVTDPGTEEGHGEVIICDKPGNGGVVPIDWVKRGGEGDPNVIFYNMAGGGPLAAGGGVTGTSNVVRGQAEKGSSIVSKGNASAQINREKKGPVALVKQGRVFLR